MLSAGRLAWSVQDAAASNKRQQILSGLVHMSMEARVGRRGCLLFELLPDDLRDEFGTAAIDAHCK